MSFRASVLSVVSRHESLFRLKQTVDTFPARFGGHPEAKSWSQHGEDDILVRELKDLVSTGFYVDIGANHPHKISNTFRLYSLGMRGITVEPNVTLMKMHEKYRPGDVSLCAASGAKDGLARFYRMSWHALSTFSEETARNLTAKGQKLISQSLVPVFTLKTILDNCSLPGRPVFALLSVDVESMDEVVLRSNDWGLYQPRLIVVEENDAGSTSIADYLRPLGYDLLATAGCNQIWKHKSAGSGV